MCPYPFSPYPPSLPPLFREHSSVRLVVIDHISSNYGIVFPVKEMVAACHSRLVTMATDVDVALIFPRGVKVLVDGAHALGSLPISMRYEVM